MTNKTERVSFRISAETKKKLLKKIKDHGYIGKGALVKFFEEIIENNVIILKGEQKGIDIFINRLSVHKSPLENSS